MRRILRNPQRSAELVDALKRHSVKHLIVDAMGSFGGTIQEQKFGGPRALLLVDFDDPIEFKTYFILQAMPKPAVKRVWQDADRLGFLDQKMRLKSMWVRWSDIELKGAGIRMGTLVEVEARDQVIPARFLRHQNSEISLFELIDPMAFWEIERLPVPAGLQPTKMASPTAYFSLEALPWMLKQVRPERARDIEALQTEGPDLHDVLISPMYSRTSVSMKALKRPMGISDFTRLAKEIIQYADPHEWDIDDFVERMNLLSRLWFIVPFFTNEIVIRPMREDLAEYLEISVQEAIEDVA